jgi:hypothetical protein
MMGRETFMRYFVRGLGPTPLVHHGKVTADVFGGAGDG